LRSLMKRCWAKRPGDRPDFDEIMRKLAEIEHNACHPIMPEDKWHNKFPFAIASSDE